MDSRKRKLIDNPLLQSTLKPSAHKLIMPAAGTKQAVHSSFKQIKDSVKYIMSPDEEKISVFEIISDLEKQLDAAFGLKDANEKEIGDLKGKLARAEEKAGMSEARLKEMKGMLVSQEELNSELEFLENERLDTVGKIKSMEEELEAGLAVTKELENQVSALTKEIEGRDVRIEQIELELSSANKTIQGFHHQSSLLEDEKEALSDKLETTDAELSGAVAERDQYKRELERAKENLDEIRLLLADTRARARGHYYKTKGK
jgi:chromosome segregation protein